MSEELVKMRRFHEKLTEVAISYFSIYGYTDAKVIMNNVWDKVPHYSRARDGDIIFQKMERRALITSMDLRKITFESTDKGWNYFYEKRRRVLDRRQIESVIKTNQMQHWSFWTSLIISVIALIVSLVR